MKRRDVLAGVGSVGALSLAGCVADDREDPGGAEGEDPTTDETTPDGTDDGTTNGTEDTTTDDDETTTDDDGDGTTDGDGTSDAASGRDNADPVELFVVGDREGVPFPENNGPHDLRVYNDAEGERTLRLRLRTPTETAFDRTVAVPAERRVEITLNEPAAYDLAVGLDGTTAGTVAVDRGYFDCNGSWTRVTVGPDGGVESKTASTLMACPGPEVAETTFEHGPGRCGGTSEASVAVADERVAVEGRVRTSAPCYDLALSEVSLEGDDDGAGGTLVVQVSTAGRNADACAQCIADVPYEASAGFENAYPERVRVVHSGPTGRETVLERDLSP